MFGISVNTITIVMIERSMVGTTNCWQSSSVSYRIGATTSTPEECQETKPWIPIPIPNYTKPYTELLLLPLLKELGANRGDWAQIHRNAKFLHSEQGLAVRSLLCSKECWCEVTISTQRQQVQWYNGRCWRGYPWTSTSLDTQWQHLEDAFDSGSYGCSVKS